jgi:hypothetical protein
MDHRAERIRRQQIDRTLDARRSRARSQRLLALGALGVGVLLVVWLKMTPSTNVVGRTEGLVPRPDDGESVSARQPGTTHEQQVAKDRGAASDATETAGQLRQLRQELLKLQQERQRLKGLSDGTLYDVTDGQWQREQSLRLEAHFDIQNGRPDRARAATEAADRARSYRLAQASYKLAECENRINDINAKISELVSPTRNPSETNAKTSPKSTRIADMLRFRLSAGNRSSDCFDGLSIREVSSEGHILVLDDDSVWEVDLQDRIDSQLWLPFDGVVACDDKLTNTDQKETVGAQRIR